jgi:hypothetical protein
LLPQRDFHSCCRNGIFILAAATGFSFLLPQRNFHSSCRNGIFILPAATDYDPYFSVSVNFGHRTTLRPVKIRANACAVLNCTENTTGDANESTAHLESR